MAIGVVKDCHISRPSGPCVRLPPQILVVSPKSTFGCFLRLWLQDNGAVQTSSKILIRLFGKGPGHAIASRVTWTWIPGPVLLLSRRIYEVFESDM